MSVPATPLRAVFFDLDGTLVDSAPDLIAALDRLCDGIGAPRADARAVREVVSRGGRAILRRGLPDADEARIEALLPDYLELYAEKIAVHTRLFPGVSEVLTLLEARDIAWGVVTNKAGWLARPLLAALGLETRCAALVSGDCLPVRKPDPAPVLRACELVGTSASASAYVGDDERDVLAGRAAGTLTVAVAWGYLDGGDPAAWGADRLVRTPQELPRALGVA